MQIKVVIGTVAFMLTMMVLGYVTLREPARLEEFTHAEHGRSIEFGAELFAGNCATCHGIEGKAQDQDEEEPLLATTSNSKINSDEPASDKKLSLFETTLALIAATIGGEIVAVPYAMQQMGIYLAVVVILGSGALSHFSIIMYLKVKDMTPSKPESVFEIAHILFGRPAIFVVCLVQYFLNYVLIVLYFIIIGDILGQLTVHFLEPKHNDALAEKSDWLKFFGGRTAWILVIGVALLFVVF